MNTTNFLSYILAGILGSGMVCAWYALGEQFIAYNNAQTSFVPLVHPMLTPCFYGSCAFVAAFVWSLLLVAYPNAPYRWFVRFLALCTLFAFAVVVYESLMYMHIIPTLIVNCSPGVHPLHTPCFSGMLFFAVSYVIAYVCEHNKYSFY